jgi:SAM-dependent methyltransferase
MFTAKQILELYKSEAEKHGIAETSTIQDFRTRKLEIDAICSYIKSGQRILEVGCGNGYTAKIITLRFKVTLDAFDFSPDLIALAQQQKIEHPKGTVTFSQKDALKFKTVKKYDLIFTERCIQNLPTWEDQQIALHNIAQSLKPGGFFVMLESFWTGLNNLNAARSELDLPKIDPPWHNLFFDEDTTIHYMSDQGCRYADQNPFLSGYYFGSRILLPAIMPKGKPVKSKSVLNDYFWQLPPAGDFCPMKIMRFQKIK